MTAADSSLIFSNAPARELDAVVERLKPDRVVAIYDSTTAALVAPRLKADSTVLAECGEIVIPAGEEHKNIATLGDVWSRMSALGLSRRSLVVNVGGGVVTDLGGFAAATFKRGVACVNIPTTLLAAVDASVGGKTAIDHDGVKNEVGVFAMPRAVIVSTCFFDTLPPREMLSGYGEMLKHALLSSREDTARLLNTPPQEMDPSTLLDEVRHSVDVKRRIVEADPTEKGLRKVLNLGHTAGHAYESWAMESGAPISHGHAVTHGLVTALVASRLSAGFESALLHTVASRVKELYGPTRFGCDDYPRLLRLMANDKKNSSAEHFNFTLLRAPGDPAIDCRVTPDEACQLFDITRDLLE